MWLEAKFVWITLVVGDLLYHDINASPASLASFASRGARLQLLIEHNAPVLHGEVPSMEVWAIQY